MLKILVLCFLSLTLLSTSVNALTRGGAGSSNFDTFSGNVGIGTTAPQQKLEIVGTAQATGFRLGTAATTGQILTTDASGVGTWQTTSGSLPSGSVNQTIRYDGSAWVANSLLYNNATNIGIGTTAPNRKLDVAGVAQAWDLVAHDVALSGRYQNTQKAFVAHNGYTNFWGGIGTGGSDSITSAQRITNTGNMVNVGSIQAGQVLLSIGGTFAAKVDYGTGSWPYFVAIGDLNGDGKADLVVANYNAASISVFINNGDGTFAAKVDYASASQPMSVAIGDLNGDGKADIAVADTAGCASVFINNGNGTFAARADYGAGTVPWSVAIGDVNGDGKADLVVTNAVAKTVSVLINNGDGTFITNVDYGTGDWPEAVAIGDLNGDGKADLAVANKNSSSVSVFINNGNGTFAAKVDYGIGAAAYSVAIGDLNGDGKADLAVANYGLNTVSVLMNNGDGTFAAKVDYGAGAQPFSVAIGDVNGDGKADLVVGNFGFGDVISVLMNNGDGTFAAKVDYGAGSKPQSVAIGDLNGDGKVDLAAANYGSDTVSVFLNVRQPMLFAQAFSGNVGIGNVGIGITTPITRQLFVQGQIGCSDAQTGATKSVYDVAEIMPVAEEVAEGDIVVLKAGCGRQVYRSWRANDPLVVGVVSSESEKARSRGIFFLGDKEQAARLTGKKHANISVAGQVEVKVCFENGTIREGDWITTSSQFGVGMKANDQYCAVGMALESFTGSSGAQQGTILMLVGTQ